jgi:hypothetical protein
MNASDIKIGQRVLVLPNGLTAIVVGRPEYWTRPNVKLVRIKYENSTRFERMINSQLELLPIEEQYPAHGGNRKRKETI